MKKILDGEIYKRIYGALMGVALGDAMGMPSEFWSRSRITRYFGKITTFLPAPKENEITRGLKAGEITDDTHMTIIVSKSIIGSIRKLLLKILSNGSVTIKTKILISLVQVLKVPLRRLETVLQWRRQGNMVLLMVEP